MRFTGRIAEFDQFRHRGVIKYRNRYIHFYESDIFDYGSLKNGLKVRVGQKVDFEIERINGYKLRVRNAVLIYDEQEAIDFVSKNWEEFEDNDLPTLKSVQSFENNNLNNDSVIYKASNLDLIALALVESKIRLVSLAKDGSYRFLDDEQKLHNILYVSAFETISLKLAVEEFEDLINSSKAKENDFQNFFERHPDFILNDDYKQAHPHVILSKDNEEYLIPDFVLEPIDQSSFCDLLELKLPTSEIFVLKKSRERYSAAIFEAAAQLRTYGRFFDEEKNRNNFRQSYPHLNIYKPRMFVIIGRQNNESSMIKREIQAEFPQLFLRTYDELLTRMKWKMNKMENKRIST